MKKNTIFIRQVLTLSYLFENIKKVKKIKFIK